VFNLETKIVEGLSTMNISQASTVSSNPKSVGKGSDGEVFVDGKIAQKKFDDMDGLVTEMLINSILPKHNNLVLFNRVDINGMSADMEAYGCDLNDFIESKLHSDVKFTKIGINQREQILIGILTGLDSIHSMELVHNDLTARNILLSFSSSEQSIRVGICDFGRTRIAGIRNGYTTSFSVASNDKIVTQAHDMFAVGILLYYMYKWNDDVNAPTRDEILQNTKDIPDKHLEIIINLTSPKAKDRLTSKQVLTKYFDIELEGDFINIKPPKAKLQHIDSDILEHIQVVRKVSGIQSDIIETIYLLYKTNQCIVNRNNRKYSDKEYYAAFIYLISTLLHYGKEFEIDEICRDLNIPLIDNNIILEIINKPDIIQTFIKYSKYM
jgi:serine/threonine protein kinase